MRPQQIDGVFFDIPAAIRIYREYDHTQCARQRRRGRRTDGQFFWIHPLVPGIAFPTRIAALEAALVNARAVA